MKTLKNVAILALLGFTIYLCFRNYKLNSYISQLPDSSVIGISDTIKLKEEFKPQKPFSQLIEPSRILLYDFYRNSNRMTKSPSSDSTAVDSDHSVKVSKKDSLVQFTLDNNKLNISLFNKETDSYSTRMFNLDLGNYKYNWYEGQLTQKKFGDLILVLMSTVSTDHLINCSILELALQSRLRILITNSELMLSVIRNTFQV